MDRRNKVQPSIFLVAPFPKKRFKGGIAHVADMVMEGFPEVTPINTLAYEGADESKGQLNLSTLKAAWVLLRELWAKVEPGSVVHYNTSRRGAYLKDMLLCVLLQMFRQVHVVWHIHFAVFDEVFRWRKVTGCLHWLFLRSVDRVVCLGRGFEDEIRAHFGARNTVYLRNPSTIDDLGSAPEPPPVRFLFMGSIDRRKGIVDLLRAFEELKVGYEAELHVCGGPVNPEVENEFETGVAANAAVHYHGYVSGDERLELIRQSHVLVLPSYSEGLPLVIVEFLRCGRPVVATAVGAIPEIIRDGENGVLIRPGDIDTLSEVLKNLALNNESFSNLRAACEQEKDQYSREIFCEELSNIYGTVADCLRNSRSIENPHE